MTKMSISEMVYALVDEGGYTYDEAIAIMIDMGYIVDTDDLPAKKK